MFEPQLGDVWHLPFSFVILCAPNCFNILRDSFNESLHYIHWSATSTLKNASLDFIIPTIEAVLVSVQYLDIFISQLRFANDECILLSFDLVEFNFRMYVNNHTCFLLSYFTLKLHAEFDLFKHRSVICSQSRIYWSFSCYIVFAFMNSLSQALFFHQHSLTIRLLWGVQFTKGFRSLHALFMLICASKNRLTILSFDCTWPFYLKFRLVLSCTS